MLLLRWHVLSNFPPGSQGANTNSAGWEQQTAKMQRCLIVRVVHYNMTSLSSGAVLNVRSFEYR